MGQRSKRKDDALRRWRRRKARLERLKSSNSTTDAPVDLIGEKAAWSKLGNRIEMIIKNEGLARLTRIRELIATDANLPMPPIRILPTGWWFPQSRGVIFGKVRPVAVKNCFQWGVIIPASTLLIVDDDTLLRRILSHEFAHCLWYTARMVREMKDGKWTFIGSAEEISIPELVDKQIKKDRSELVDPTNWFGKWDVEHFLPEGGQPLDEATNKFATHWIKAGLPTQPPDMSMDVQGTFQFHEKIIERIKQLDEKASPDNK